LDYQISVNDNDHNLTCHSEDLEIAVSALQTIKMTSQMYSAGKSLMSCTSIFHQAGDRKVVTTKSGHTALHRT